MHSIQSIYNVLVKNLDKQLVEYYSNQHFKEIVIWGTGSNALFLLKILKNAGLQTKIKAFCNSFHENGKDEFFENYIVYSPTEIIENFKNSSILVASFNKKAIIEYSKKISNEFCFFIEDESIINLEKNYARLQNIEVLPKIEFSIIIPTFNRGNLISTAIDSALNQDFSGQYEIVVVDDGSTDNTLQLIKNKYSTEVKIGKLKVFQSPHLGVSGARNIGLENSLGNWICYLDSDNTITNDYLSTFVEQIILNPYCEFFYAQHIVNNKIIEHEYDRESLLKENYIDMGIICHSKSLYLTYGGFDVKLSRLVDWDLIIKYTGHTVPVYVPKIILNYNNSEKLTDRITKSYSFYENYEKITSKNLNEIRLYKKMAILENQLNCILSKMNNKE